MRISPFATSGQAHPRGTLAEMMARQKALADRQAQPGPQGIQSPWQGAGYLAQKVVEGFQGMQNRRELDAGRQQLADIYGRMTDTGDFGKPEDRADLMTLAPDQGMEWIKAGIESRRHLAERTEDRAWHVEDREDTQAAAAELANAKEGAWKPTDIAARADDYTKAAATYDQASPTWQSMKQSVGQVINLQEGQTSPGAGAADYALVVGLAKILDPTSVVREGEVESVRSTGGAADYLIGYLNQLKGGGSLSPDVRKGIMTQAETRMKAYYDQAAAKRAWISDVATRHSVDPNDVVPPLAAFEPYAAGGGGGGGRDLSGVPDNTVPQQGDFIMKNGKKLTFTGGDPEDRTNWAVVGG